MSSACFKGTTPFFGWDLLSSWWKRNKRSRIPWRLKLYWGSNRVFSPRPDLGSGNFILWLVVGPHQLAEQQRQEGSVSVAYASPETSGNRKHRCRPVSWGKTSLGLSESTGWPHRGVQQRSLLFAMAPYRGLDPHLQLQRHFILDSRRRCCSGTSIYLEIKFSD